MSFADVDQLFTNALIVGTACGFALGFIFAKAY